MNSHNSPDIASSMPDSEQEWVDISSSSSAQLEPSSPEDISPENSPRGRTITVYFCGTCSKRSDAVPNPNSYPNGELVSSLYSITRGQDGIDKIIVDGIGSGEEDVDDYWVEYKKYPQMMAIASGMGFSERIDHVLAVLKNEPKRNLNKVKEIDKHQQIKNAPRLTRINIVGWSRGGAQAITLAHRLGLDSQLKEIEVNLIVLDPVPGPGQVLEENVKLLPNVKNCLAFYARDERSQFFEPIVPQFDNTKTQFIPLIVPGAHNHLVGSVQNHKGETLNSGITTVGILTRAYTQHALTYYGTKLNPSSATPMPFKQSLNLYWQLSNTKETYTQAAQGSSYTINRNTTSSRYVIANNVNWLCTPLDDALKSLDYQKSGNGYHLDFCHEKVEALINASNTFMFSFRDSLKAFLERKVILSLADVHVSNAELWKNLEDNPVLICSILEDFQKYFHSERLSNFENRCYDLRSLKKYVDKILDEIIRSQNEEITLANNSLEAAREAKLACDQAYQDLEIAEIVLRKAREILYSSEENLNTCNREYQAAEATLGLCQRNRTEVENEDIAPAQAISIPRKNNHLFRGLLLGSLISLPLAATFIYWGALTLTYIAVKLALTLTLGNTIGASIGYFQDRKKQDLASQLATQQEQQRVEAANELKQNQIAAAKRAENRAETTLSSKENALNVARAIHEEAIEKLNKAQHQLNVAQEIKTQISLKTNRTLDEAKRHEIQGNTNTYKKLVGFFEEKYAPLEQKTIPSTSSNPSARI